MRSNQLFVSVFALGALFGSSNVIAFCVDRVPVGKPAVAQNAAFHFPKKARLVKVECGVDPAPVAPPTVAPSDADEAKRAVGMSSLRKFADPLMKPKSGGLIQFETPIKNKKIKTCS